MYSYGKLLSEIKANLQSYVQLVIGILKVNFTTFIYA